jgi:hypothetical protein
MNKLDNVSTRELLETLKRRGQRALLFDYGSHQDNVHLVADAEHLLKCLNAEVLDYPYAQVGAR